MMHLQKTISCHFVALIVYLVIVQVNSFSLAPIAAVKSKRVIKSSSYCPFTNRQSTLNEEIFKHQRFAVDDGNEDVTSTSESILLNTSDQVVLGGTGTVASLIMLYSEFVLKTTGCGLPAGPLGLVGAIEGLSYLSVTALVLFSLYSKITTGKGLPAGPKGILGAAEGLSFFAIVFGLFVLSFQVIDYGYIPNAVPMEGGMCK